MKKLLSIILSVLMVVTMIPFTPLTASAAETTIIAQGECGAEGSSVQWMLDDTGTLTIFGTGAMADYGSSSRPWEDYETEITTVVVENGVTYVGTNSFRELDNLTIATIADSVEEWGDYVFYVSPKLESVKLSSRLKTIGIRTFAYCEVLTSIVIPKGVTIIKNEAFYYCTALNSIILPNTVTEIWYNAFSNCPKLSSKLYSDAHYLGTEEQWDSVYKQNGNSNVEKYLHYCTEKAEIEATCQAEGSEGGWYCETCAKYIEGGNTIEINPDNHEYEKNNGFCCETYQPAELNENGYYEISNAGQLFWFANHVNTVDRTANAVLVADIDLENRPWTPIGSTGENSNNFRGVFDGQGYTIKGLYVEGGRAGLGFFGEVRTGTVKNFTIYGEVVANTEVNYVGGVIGSICGVNGENDLERNGAIIQNIRSFVNLTAKAHGIGMIGGFVGYANHQSLIENCSWYGTFDAGKYRVDSGAGGFIGKIQENSSEVTIRNCGAYGTIKTNYAGDYNNTATIYMGGFLSFSNTNAQTTIENCLFAGKFERGDNLTDQAFLGAFGTLRSVKAIKNCYYLGDDGLAAVHSDSDLKPGSDNVEITKVTEEQLKSGEIAYRLQEANEIWGQKIGTDDYPVLGGESVYYGYVSCADDAVTVYTNDSTASDKKPAHNWSDKDGICANGCGERAFNAINGMTADSEKRILSGIAPGSESLDGYTEILVDGIGWTLENGVGTGCTATLGNTEEVFAEYTILIFGDVNGDGWYDGQDAVIVSCLANGMLTQEDVSEAVYTAADCNHDGVIDQLDVDLLNQAGALLANVDQSKSAEVLLETSSEYVEYLDLIDQSPEIEIEDETDTPEADTEDSTQQDARVDVFEMILNFIRFIIEMLLSYIPMPIK